MNPNIDICLLLLLGMAIPALSNQCPDADRLPTTCTCEDDGVEDKVDVALSCEGATLQELKDALRLMDKDSRLEIELDEMLLGVIPSDLFNGLNVVRLDISHSEVDALVPTGEIPLHGLEDTLEELVIIGIFSHDEDRRTELPSLDHLRRLRELALSHNTIGEMHDHWFAKPPPALRSLTLSHNSIRHMGDQAFENLVDLEVLELHGNRFDGIKRSMFPRSGNRLEKLELDNNAITDVPNDLFKDMPNLRILSLTDNGFTQLQAEAFKPIWSQLEIFDVRGNPLVCDSSMEWLFHVQTEASMILGTCFRPENKEGVELKDFIHNMEL